MSGPRNESEEEVSEFDRVSGLAQRVIRETERRRIPPNPHVYEVLFKYADGEDTRLKESVDEVLANSDDVDLRALERIYRDHLGHEQMSNGVLRVGDKLNSEMSEIAQLLEQRTGANESFIGHLDRAQDGMSMFTRTRDVKQMIRELIDVSRSYAEETTLFGTELELSRSQINELQIELDQLRQSVYLDHLTGIPNRRRVDMVLAEEVRASLEGRGPLCFVLADLDKFKKLNDTWGHDVGDSVLKQFAQILKNNTKGQDTPGRFGGEEFAIILPETGLMGARHITEHIRQLLSAKAFVEAETKQSIGQVSASFGVAQIRPDDTVESLIKRADTLLYEAKDKGRNCVVSAA